MQNRQVAAVTAQTVTSLPGPSGKIRSTWKLMTRPYQNYSAWSRQFGKTFLINALNGNVVVTSNPENIRRVLALRHDEISQFAVGTLSPLIGESSVLIVDGQKHKRARAMLAPPFHKEAIAKTVPVMTAIADRIAEQWTVGETIRTMDHSLDYSLEVIIEVIFGVQQSERVEQFKHSIKRYVKSFRPVFAFSKLMQKRVFPSWCRFLKEKAIFDKLFDEQIALSRDPSTSLASHGFLSMLLDAHDEDGMPLKDDELKAQLISLLFAGHETTQIAIGWAMSWLHRHRPALERLRSEFQNDDATTLLQSEWLHGVCCESLRLNPIVPDFLRVLEKPVQLEEVDLPAKSSVGILSCVVHQDPEIFPNPTAFLPERWIGTTYKPHEFLAFGGGVRRCIGANMALLEMKVALIQWLRKFEFSLPENAPESEPVHRRNLTMAPKSGIPLVVRKKS